MSRSRHLLSLVSLCLLAACDGSDPVGPGDGQIRISVVMSGLDLDVDGTLVSVNDGAPRVVPFSGPLMLTLSPGRYSLTLGGLAANCTLDGPLTREVEIVSGVISPFVFFVTCGAVSGVLEVSVRTSGSQPDVDGYLVRVDGGPAQRVLSESVTRFAPVASGLHSVSLIDLAPNCAVDGDNPQAGVSVGAGGPTRDTASVAFLVVCNPRFGSLKVVASTSGPADPNGYLVTLETSPASHYRLGASDSLEISNFPSGTYRFGVSDLAGNCSLASAPPEWVTIVGGAELVVRISVTCVEPAILRVSAPTTGSDPDPGYLVGIDGGAGSQLIAGSTLEISLPPGDHTVELMDVAANCTVSGGQRAAVNLAAGAVTDLVFAVTCVAAARTGLDLIVSTTGSDLDRTYLLTICADFYCYERVFESVVPASFTLQLNLAAGSYGVYLNDVADNCGQRQTGTGTVTQGAVSTIRIDVTCGARASFAATVTATGSDIPPLFRLALDGRDAAWMPPGAAVTVSTFEGQHQIALATLPENCQVIGPNPMTVTLVAGVVTPVGFSVECQAYPVYHVSVTTSGSNIPDAFLVGVDPDLFYGYVYSSAITPNGSIDLRLNKGDHEIWLDLLPGNCTVDGTNPLRVNAPHGSRTEVAFAVTCR